MSIEKILTELSETIVALTDALQAQTALLKGAASGKAEKAAPKAEKAAPKAEKAEKPAAKAKATKVTADTIKQKFGAYLAVEDTDLADEHKTNVASILRSLGAKKVSAIPEESFEEALSLLQEYIDSEDEGSEEAADSDDDEGLM
jgi:gas vesicle protein